VLTAHVAAAARTMTDRGWRVSKLKQTSPIDALAAVVLAAYFAAQDTTSVYLERGMFMLGRRRGPLRCRRRGAPRHGRW
jgi:hypothetical protein